MESSRFGEVTGDGVCGNPYREGCGQVIFWVKTRAGKNMPVDADDTCHYETCPKGENFRAKQAANKPARPAKVELTGEIQNVLEDGTWIVKPDSKYDLQGRNTVQIGLRIAPPDPDDDLPF